MKNWLIFGGIVVVSFFLYLLLIPFFTHGIDVLSPPVFQEIGDAVMYYQIVGLSAGVLSGTAGVMLGLFFFFSRKKQDEVRSGQLKREQQVRLIVDELNRYDEAVARILTQHFSSEKELQYLRHMVDSYAENIYESLSVLEKSGESFSVFVHTHSFVDNSKVIMDWKLEDFELGPVGLSAELVLYSRRISTARKSCYQLVTSDIIETDKNTDTRHTTQG